MEPVGQRPPEASLLGTTLGRFKILSELGRGGMGVVYRAEDRDLRRLVALKVLPPELSVDPERRARLLREARAAATIVHPSIATIYEVGESGGIVYVAMELIAGDTLRARLAGGRLQPVDAARIARDVAEGLAVAHAVGIVHRDLKPENLMLAGEQVRILDFGVAKLQPGAADPSGIDETLTSSGVATVEGSIVGTPAYMSPEQARGRAVDARSDVFSLGVVLYEMLAGKPPFSGGSALEVALAITNDAPLPVSQLSREVPAALERIVMRCLEKDPARRYQTVAELIADLRGAGAASDVRQPAQPVEGSRPVRSKRVQVVALGVALALLGAWAASRRLAQPAWSPVLASAAALSAAAGASVRPAASDAPDVPVLGWSERALTANPDDDSITDGAISPDGTRFATIDRSGVVVRPLAGDGAHTFAPQKGARQAALAWLPDGSGLVVTETASSGVLSLWKLVIASGERMKLRDRAALGTLSRDGASIAFLAEGGIWKMALDGSGAKILVPGTGLVEGGKALAGDLGRPVFSPDGRRIAYSRVAAGRDEVVYSIETTAIDGGPPLQVLADYGLRLLVDYATNLAWLPDGRLVFAVRQFPPDGEGANVWEIAVDAGSGAARGARRKRSAWANQWETGFASSTDGRKLSLLRMRDLKDLYVAPLDASGSLSKPPERFTIDDRVDEAPAWTADSQAVLFQSSRGGFLDLLRQPLGSRIATPLTPPGGDVEHAPAATAGGDVLYLATRFQRSTRAWLHLMRQPASGGPALQLADLPNAMGTGVMTGFLCALGSSRRCIICRVREQRGVCSELDPERGIGQDLFSVDHPLYPCSWSLSPDGARLAHLTPTDRVVIRSLDDSTARELRASECDARCLSWDARGQSLIATCGRRVDRKARIVAIDPSGRQRTLHELPYQDVESAVISPDGRHLAFDMWARDVDLWLVEGL